MRLTPLRQNGLKAQFMPINFSALNVKPCVLKLSASGSIGDRPFTWRTAAANGRNFTTVAVGKFGGLGVLIVRHLGCNKTTHPLSNLGHEGADFSDCSLDLQWRPN
jgi:hypothetical protein